MNLKSSRMFMLNHKFSMSTCILEFLFRMEGFEEKKDGETQAKVIYGLTELVTVKYGRHQEFSASLFMRYKSWDN